jgi:hypothetical protein
MTLGASMWKIQSVFSGNPTFEPDFLATIAWFTFSSFMSGLADPRSPWINWISIYIGTYVLALPFFPRDPLVGLALFFGFFLTAFCTILGALVPTVFAYTAPLKSNFLRKWAGYHGLPKISNTGNERDDRTKR